MDNREEQIAKQIINLAGLYNGIRLQEIVRRIISTDQITALSVIPQICNRLVNEGKIVSLRYKTKGNLNTHTLIFEKGTQFMNLNELMHKDETKQTDT
jgi:hypothetical protein